VISSHMENPPLRKMWPAGNLRLFLIMQITTRRRLRRQRL
jgi:hypothetical protein